MYMLSLLKKLPNFHFCLICCGSHHFKVDNLVKTVHKMG